MNKVIGRITLREKFLLLVGLAVVVPFLLFYFFARQFVYWNLQILEDDLALRDMRTVDNSLTEREEFLSLLLGEYVSRSDIYRNVAAQNSSRLAAIFSPSFAEHLSLRRIFVFGDQENLLYEHGNWDEFASATNQAGRLLLSRLRRQPSLSGYVRTDKAVYMFAAQKIATPEEPKKTAGTIIFARRLQDILEINVAGEMLRTIYFHTISAGDASKESGGQASVLPEGLAARFQDKSAPYLIEQRSEDQTSVFFPLNDYRDELAGVIEVIFPRESLRAALSDVQRILLVLLAGGIVFALAMAALLARFTVQPARQLRRQVMDIRQSRDLSQRVALTTQDEIGQVADAFNHLLDALHAAEQELLRKNRDLYHLSTIDELTQLHNRRSTTHNLEKEFARARRYEHDLSCMILDLDHFKNVNDTHGHPTGDRVLNDMAGILRANTRQVDIIGRWGGEEFLVILPLADQDEAYNCAERIRLAVESRNFGSQKKPIKLTASIGLVSLLGSRAKNIQDLLRFADEALYQAKSAGRNRTSVYKRAAREQSTV
jgi:diguanylate cyclase (GGDEF)-like protein